MKRPKVATVGASIPYEVLTIGDAEEMRKVVVSHVSFLRQMLYMYGGNADKAAMKIWWDEEFKAIQFEMQSASETNGKMRDLR